MSDPTVRGPSGRVVLVAGATSATGRAVVGALRSAGATVVAVGSDAGRLAAVGADVSLVCDLADPAAVAALVGDVHATAGPIDGLVHLVGGWRGGHADADWQWLQERVVTTLRTTSIAFRDDLVASTAGRLAIVSSTAVDAPAWGNANYAATKAAAEAWVSALASGWAKGGTAAAVTYVVRALGPADGDTPPEVLAARIAELWDTPAASLNGARISLVDTSADRS
jgi:3-oxoacyl-[acyl-carrier protein] reductase